MSLATAPAERRPIIGHYPHAGYHDDDERECSDCLSHAAIVVNYQTLTVIHTP